MTAPRLSLVILAVEDVARSVAFYRAVTAWTAMVETLAYVELVSPNAFRFGLYDRHSFGKNIQRVPEPIAGPVATTELYLFVDDIESSITRARDAGATLLDEPAERAWGDRVGYVADPDGYVIAFAQTR